MKTTNSFRKSKYLRTVFASTLSFVLLSGCDSDGGKEKKFYSKVGTISIEDSVNSSGTTDIDIEASFSRFSSPISRNKLESVDFFQLGFTSLITSAGLAPDSCVALASLSSERSNMSDGIDSDVMAQDLSAGDQISVRRSGSVLVDLTADSDNIYYDSVNVEYPLAQDARMTITIPGGEFGTFPTLEVPEVEQIVLSNPPQFPLVAGMSTINWVPATDENSTLMLMLMGENFFTDTTDLSVCLLVDDGDFMLPSELAESLNALNVNPEFSFMFLVRSNESTTVQGDTIVNVQRVSNAIVFE